MSPFSEASLHQLARDASWLHRLAQRLVKDAADAEDAAQEALVTALRSADPRSAERGWLAGVLNNVLRQDWRRKRLRTAREAEAAARTSAGPAAEPADEVAARIEACRSVVEAVAALDEPYRTAIALRFFDQLTPREIAARCGVPRKTVYTRIERGLERLRTSLDRDYGTRSGWATALLPFLQQPPPTATAPLAAPPLIPITLGALTMGTALKWTAIAATTGLLLWVLRPDGAPPEAVMPESAAANPVELAPVPGAVAPDGLAEPSSVAGRSARLPARDPDPAPRTAPAAPVETFTGRTVDLAQRPVAGVEVSFEASAPGLAAEPGRTAVTDVRGVFELPVPEGSGSLEARGKGLAQVNTPALFGRAPAEAPVIYMAPAVRLSGRVVDPGGQPVAGADVAVHLPPGRAAELLGGAMSKLAPLAAGVSGPDGRFELAPFGAVEGSYLMAARAGFRSTRVTLPAGPDPELAVVLEPLDPGAASFAGLVLDRSGRPVADAWVTASAASDASTRSDADGRFVLEVEGAPTGSLRAVAAGHLPAELEVAAIPESSRHAVELILGEAPASIRGRVVDAEGQPLADVEVWTADGEHFAKVARRIGDVEVFIRSSVEELIQPDGRRTRTDREGRFELTGLLLRDYDLLALNRATLELVQGPNVRAPQASVTLRMAGEQPTRPLAGRVVNYAGEPLADVRVGLDRTVPTPLGEGRVTTSIEPRTSTDRDGRFELGPVVIEGTSLVLLDTGAAMLPRFELEGRSDLDALELRVPEVCHLRVTLDDPDYADGLSVLNADGDAMMFTFNVGELRLSAAGAGLEDGRSDLLEINETAATLVLHRGGEEVLRVPLNPRGGEVEEVRL